MSVIGHSQTKYGAQDIILFACLLPCAACVLMIIALEFALRSATPLLAGWIMLGGLSAIFLGCLVFADVLTARITKPLQTLINAPAQAVNPLPIGQEDESIPEIRLLSSAVRNICRQTVEARIRERSIIDASIDGLLTVDEALTIKSANATASRILGNQRALEGTALTELITETSLDNLRAFFMEVKDAGKPDTINLSFANASLEGLTTSLSARWSNKDQLYACILNDISERKEQQEAKRLSEIRLRTMLEQMPAGLLLLDQSYGITFVNRTACQLLNRASRDILGRHLCSALPIPQSRIQEPLSLKSSPILISLKTPGETAQLEITIHPTYSANGQSFVALLVDVSYNQKIELLRNRLLESIEGFGTPLAAMSKVLRRIELEVTDTTGDTGHLNHIKSADLELQRIASLFSEFLRVEQSNAAQLSLQRRQVSVRELMERTLEAVRIAAERKKINISAGDLDALLYVDPERIVQVLVNLVINALKFTPVGGHVRIAATHVAENTIEFRVLDTGPGIAASMETHIFEPFKQTSAEDAVKRGGSGLGLFICKTLVEKHGGTIGVRNRAEGAEFWARLPIDDLKARRLAEYAQLQNLRLSDAAQLADRAEFERSEPKLAEKGLVINDGIYDLLTSASKLQDHREFSRKDGRLDDGGAPARRDTHYVLHEFSAGEQTSFAPEPLARPGFASDFHDATPFSVDSRSGFRGDPAKIPLAEVKVKRGTVITARYLLPMLVAALCIALYAVPATIWRVPDTTTSAAFRHRQLSRIEDDASQSLSDGGAPASQPFSLPAGSVGPSPAPAAGEGAGTDFSLSSNLPSAKPAGAKVPDRSDASEFALADSSATLPQLEQLIYKHIAKREFRRARDLAVAGFRSAAATKEQKAKFWQLYCQYAPQCR